MCGEGPAGITAATTGSRPLDRTSQDALSGFEELVDLGVGMTGGAAGGPPFYVIIRFIRALGWSSADYIQIHCGALCAD